VNDTPKSFDTVLIYLTDPSLKLIENVGEDIVDVVSVTSTVCLKLVVAFK
jgi:hypothetical protein